MTSVGEEQPTKRDDHDDNNNDNNNNENNTVKSSAFGICFIRSLLSLLPPEAGAMRYDPQTPHFEGVALEFNVNSKSPFGPMTMERAREAAHDYAAHKQQSSAWMSPDKDWHGFEFNVCRAKFVDRLLLQSMAATTSSSPIKQVVFCGIGQDYRGMRHGKAIAQHGAKVFELDLAPMMELRRTIKDEILKRHATLTPQDLPETHELAIDFGSQHVSQVLLECPAFDPAIPTLYIWEGVSYYLTPEAMKSFLLDIYKLVQYAPPQQRHSHRIFFDHLIDLPSLPDDDLPGKTMLQVFAHSEPLQSFLDFDQVGPYLHELGFEIDEQLLPDEMYKPYQTTSNPLFHLTKSKYFGMVVAKPAAAETRED